MAQMNKLRITNPYTHSGWISNPAEQAPAYYEATVENLTSSLIVHEWYGHGVRRYGGNHKIFGFLPYPNHHKVYEMVKGYKRFYEKTTPKYKSFVNQKWKDYYEKEK